MSTRGQAQPGSRFRPMTAAGPGVRRQARSIRNDERILEAACAITADDGWAGLLPARVAEAAGLSHPAVSARFANRSEIAAGVWRDRLAGEVIAKLAAVLDSGGLLTPGGPDPRVMANAMSAFIRPDQAMCAAAELLVMSNFDADVRRAVQDTLGASLTAWLTPSPRRVSRAQAARRSFLVITALGSLLEVRRQVGARLDLRTEWDRICAALASPDSIHTLPHVHFEHWDGVFDFDTGDALLDRLLEATRDEIGRHGYEATTVDGIARAAGRTKGLVFSRYPSKRQLFNDTVTRYARGMYDLNEQAWKQMQETMSAGIGEAVLYREFMRPGRERLRAFALEQYRLSWHDAEMRESISHAMSDVIATRLAAEPTRSRKEMQADIFISAAQGIGVLLVADCCPSAWELPYQHVTEPLNS